MNDQVPRLGAFGGPGPFSVGSGRFFLAGRRGRTAGVVKWTGLRWAFGLLRHSLEPPDFFLELLDDADQRLDQWSPLLRRNLNAANGLGAGLPCHARMKPSSPLLVKTNFHQGIEK